MTSDMSKFSEWLFQELNERGVSQSQLARGTGLTRQAISYYLSDKSKRPDDAALKDIAKFFKLPIEKIYREAGILPPKSKEDQEKEEILYEIQDLTPEEKLEVLAFIRMKKNLRKKNGHR